ncbi:hypothetical protein [Enterococcus sp. LJL51]|uniref:hypothetical protein n=1 Tax=Enterococcus sp. LJL51 TaxID=3416656 RepID=UPI003CEC84C1
MKVLNIEYPTTLDKIEDITDDNIDVFVELEDGFSYTVIVSTVQNIAKFMEEKGYSSPGWVQQLIVVTELKEDLIKKAIEAYAEEHAYWLKFTHLSTGYYLEDLDRMLEKERRFYNDDEA